MRKQTPEKCTERQTSKEKARHEKEPINANHTEHCRDGADRARGITTELCVSVCGVRAATSVAKTESVISMDTLTHVCGETLRACVCMHVCVCVCVESA